MISINCTARLTSLAMLLIVSLALLVACQQPPPPKPPQPTSQPTVPIETKPKTFRVMLEVTCSNYTVKSAIEQSVASGLARIPDVELVTNNHQYSIRIYATSTMQDQALLTAVAYTFTKIVKCSENLSLDGYVTSGVQLVGEWRFQEFFEGIAATFNLDVLAPERGRGT